MCKIPNSKTTALALTEEGGNFEKLRCSYWAKKHHGGASALAEGKTIAGKIQIRLMLLIAGKS